jgi:hypothetical protein
LLTAPDGSLLLVVESSYDKDSNDPSSSVGLKLFYERSGSGAKKPSRQYLPIGCQADREGLKGSFRSKFRRRLLLQYYQHGGCIRRIDGSGIDGPATTTPRAVFPSWISLLRLLSRRWSDQPTWKVVMLLPAAAAAAKLVRAVFFRLRCDWIIRTSGRRMRGLGPRIPTAHS